MVGALLFGGVFALGGLLIVGFGVVTYVRGRVVARGPQSPLGNEGEQLYCTGTVVTEASETAPLTGEACINYELVLERDSGGDSSGYRELAAVRTANDFVVDEGDARVRFEGELVADTHELFALDTHRTVEWVEDEADVPRSVRETGLLADAELSLSTERLVERRLDHGDPACCVGTFEPDGRAGATHRFRSGGVTSTFSNEPPGQFETGSDLVSVAASVVFGASLCFFGGGIVVATLGWV